MRISGGEFGGRTLRTPKGDATRPTSDMVRQSLCNILASRLPEARFLDLFAGCGSVGLEALSRGSATATFVEKGRPALDCLRGNIVSLAVTDAAVVLPCPVERALEQFAHQQQQFDIIFLDPPFADVAAYLAVLQKIATGGLLSPDGIVIAQHDIRVSLPDQLQTLTRYRLHPIGDNALSFYQQAP